MRKAELGAPPEFAGLFGIVPKLYPNTAVKVGAMEIPH